MFDSVVNVTYSSLRLALKQNKKKKLPKTLQLLKEQSTEIYIPQ
jgi:hypothetical protein